jgi:hypothetical protein
MPGRGISRRKVLSAAGLAAVAVPLAATGRANAASLVRRADAAEIGSPDYTQRDQFVMRKSLRKDHGFDRLAGAAATR